MHIPSSVPVNEICFFIGLDIADPEAASMQEKKEWPMIGIGRIDHH
jgi:hypothetical protein